MTFLPSHIQIALAELGYRETAPNVTKYSAAYDAHGTYSYQGQAWCAIFAWWCLQEAGVTLPVMQYGAYPGAASVRYLLAGCEAQGWPVTVPEPGDLFFLDHHVGFVVRVIGELIVTVEGNTSGPTPASEWVYVHTRKIVDCLGFARVPRYLK